MHKKTFAPKPKRKVGKIISDNIGNPVGIEIIEQGENEMPIQETVNIGAIVNEFQQRRNKQLKVLLLMSAMEM